MDKKLEERKVRFARLAPKRTQAILDKLAILRHCANKSAYIYSLEDIEKIFNAIEEEVARTKTAFEIKYKRRFKL